MAELRAYMLCQFCITPLLLQMSLTFSPFIIRGLEGRGEKLENNFTLFFNLKSDWKRNLLFRSSSCASTLSQVKKKPFSSLLRNWIEDMRTLSKSLSQQFLIIITTVPNFFFPKEAWTYIFSRFFGDQSSVSHSIQLCSNINLFQTDLNMHCVQSLSFLKNICSPMSSNSTKSLPLEMSQRRPKPRLILPHNCVNALKTNCKRWNDKGVERSHKNKHS